MSEIPADFHLLEDSGDMLGSFAPIYIRRKSAEELVLGFHVAQQHSNPRGHCHGGTWATVADVLMGMTVGYASGKTGPTVSMTVDYLDAAIIGQWVEGHGQVLRWTHNLGFAQCVFTADGKPALRANAIFRRKFPPFRNF